MNRALRRDDREHRLEELQKVLVRIDSADMDEQRRIARNAVARASRRRNRGIVDDPEDRIGRFGDYIDALGGKLLQVLICQSARLRRVGNSSSGIRCAVAS